MMTIMHIYTHTHICTFAYSMATTWSSTFVQTTSASLICFSLFTPPPPPPPPNKLYESSFKVFVPNEDMIDMSTALSGSGPAYVFLIMESLIDAGVRMGFSRPISTKLVQQTMLGSTMYAIESGEHPATLRNNVTSPAGTTAAALSELERGRIRTVLSDAVMAAYQRAVDMGEKDPTR